MLFITQIRHMSRLQPMWADHSQQSKVFSRGTKQEVIQKTSLHWAEESYSLSKTGTGLLERQRRIGNNLVAPYCSIRTVKHVLAEKNIKKWQAKKRALLTKEHSKQRLAWALAHKDWDISDWEGVIFSDECMVEKSKNSRVDWVFRTPAEKWDNDCI